MKRRILSIVLLASITIATVIWLRRRVSPHLMLKLNGDAVEILSAAQISDVNFRIDPPDQLLPESESLLAKYLTAHTLDQYDALFVAGESPTLTSQQFLGWKQNLDMMEKRITLVCEIEWRGKRGYILDYDSLYNGEVLTDIFLEKRVDAKLYPLKRAENLEFEVIQDFFRTLTPQGIKFLVENPSSPSHLFLIAHDAAAAFDHRLRALVSRASNHYVLDGNLFIQGLNAYGTSSDPIEKLVASSLLGAQGVHAVKMLTASDLNDEMRKTNAALIAFMKRNTMTDNQMNDVLLAIVNKQYMLAAQKLRDYCSGGKGAVYDYVTEINRLYGSVIQIYSLGKTN